MALYHATVSCSLVQSNMPNLQKMKITMLLTRPVIDSYICVSIDVTCYVVA
ncbi:hypothetical protein SORBI_3002G154450 [Sorghum bicolor]|uniref:Uncharacterized protein n=1 Tax=Sorghum bicolor TaxID=4558 RepID=A0A1W0W496_SORBI|nr:hypothetical protein SORBI_3002G154450 [Sorghum bicolor]